MKAINKSILLFCFLCFACRHTPNQSEETSRIDDHMHVKDTSTTQVQRVVQDYTSECFIAMLKQGIDSVEATINDSNMFVAHQGQLMLYWDGPHSAFIADGRFGYIPPENLMKVDTTYFKFNFSRYQFIFNKEYELYLAAQRVGVDLNNLVKRVQNKDRKAIYEFFNLRDAVDGASAEEFYNDFWALINLWTDEELSEFVFTLLEVGKKRILQHDF